MDSSNSELEALFLPVYINAAQFIIISPIRKKQIKGVKEMQSRNKWKKLNKSD
jgi:hypothetical protein